MNDSDREPREMRFPLSPPPPSLLLGNRVRLRRRGRGSACSSQEESLISVLPRIPCCRWPSSFVRLFAPMFTSHSSACLPLFNPDSVYRMDMYADTIMLERWCVLFEAEWTVRAHALPVRRRRRGNKHLSFSFVSCCQFLPLLCTLSVPGLLLCTTCMYSWICCSWCLVLPNYALFLPASIVIIFPAVFHFVNLDCSCCETYLLNMNFFISTITYN